MEEGMEVEMVGDTEEGVMEEAMVEDTAEDMAAGAQAFHRS